MMSRRPPPPSLVHFPQPTVARVRRSHGVTFRVLSVLVVAGMIVAYAGGVSKAHWSLTTESTATAQTGGLQQKIVDPPDRWEFVCETRFPVDPVSFVRLWEPGQSPGAATSAGSGAVKFEESAMEGGAGLVVAPDPAYVGDHVRVTFADDTTFEVTSWVEKGTEPGGYIGFRYHLTPADATVTVDVKHGPDIDRSVLSGEGLWPPAGALTGIDDGDPDDRTSIIVGCEEPGQTSSFQIGNGGSIPATPYLLVTEPDTAANDSCESFDVSLARADDIVYAGPLCGLIDRQLELAPQLAPGDRADFTLAFSLAFPIAPAETAEEITEGLVFDYRLAQWNGGVPGGAGSYGWVVSEPVPVHLLLTILPPPLPISEVAAESTSPAEDEGLIVAPAPTTEGPSPSDPLAPVAEPAPTAEPDPEPIPAPTPTTEPPPQGDEPPSAADPSPSEGLPPGDEPPPAADPPSSEEPPPSEEIPPSEDPPTEGEPPAAEPQPSGDETVDELSGLMGNVWNDLNGDGVRIGAPPLEEPPIRKATVLLFDDSGQKVAQTKTDKLGAYEFSDLNPGSYYVEFVLPVGYEFRDPTIPITVDPAALAETLEIDVSLVTVADIVEVWRDEVGGTVTWHGATETFALGQGNPAVSADAAVVGAQEIGPEGEEPAAPDETAPLPGQPNPNAAAPTPPEEPEVTGDDPGDPYSPPQPDEPPSQAEAPNPAPEEQP